MDKINVKTHNKVPIKLADFNMMPLLLALVVGFVLVALFVILRRRASSRRDFLLTGLCESGKSALFMQLLHSKLPETFTSITETVGTYTGPGNASARIVDIPGHYRVRDKYFEQYKVTAKGIVFVVDSVTAQKEIRDVADALYSVLADGATLSCPVMVVCNKQDMTTAKGAQVIKSILEKEMNIVRDTRSRKLQSVGEEDASTKSIYLGKEGRDFEFSQISQNVQFCEASVKDNEIASINEWLEKML